MTPIIPHDYYKPAERTVFASAFVVTHNNRFIGNFGADILMTMDDPGWDDLKTHLSIRAQLMGYNPSEVKAKKQTVIYSREKGEVL